MRKSCQQSRPRSTAVIVAVVLLASAAVAPAAETEELEIVYLANEGFLLRTGQAKVLVDAVFGDGLFGYDVVPAGERDRIEAARPPYSGVDLVLASHFHGDHFNAPAVARLLRASPSTRFVSTEDAVRKLLKYDGSLSDRVQGIYPAEGEQLRMTVSGIGLTVFNLHHGRGSEIQNLGLAVELCGLAVLHLGDAETDGEEMRRAGLGDLRTDVALVPSWYLRPGRWEDAIDTAVQAQRLVAMHIPSSQAPASYFWDDLGSRTDLAEAVQGRFPDAFVPLESGEAISVPCRSTD